MAEKVMQLGEALEAPIEGDMYIIGTPVGDAWIPVPQYSTDIAAAWQVVEHLKNRNDFEIYYDVGAERWSAAFSADGSRRAETAPLAICRAALATIGTP